MDNRKKLIIVALIVLTVVLGGASIFISLQLQQNQSSEDASASARDDDPASGDLYSSIDALFSANACADLLTEDSVELYARDTFTEVTDLEFESIASYPNVNMIGCNVFFADGSQINLEVNTYPTNTTVGQTIENITDDIDSETLESVIKSGSVIYSPYSFGEVQNDPTSCQTNIFHKLNDFEYISLTYKNFNEDCEDLQSLSTEVAYVVSVAAHNITSKLKSVQ